MFPLPSFEQDAQRFLSAISREHYLHGAGLKPTLDLTPLYDAHKHLFTVDTFQEIQEVEEPPLEDKQRRFMLDFIAHGVLEDEVKQLSERIAEEQSTTTIEWDGDAISYRSAPVRWANEPEQERRRELYKRWLAETDRLNRLYIDRQEQAISMAP